MHLYPSIRKLKPEQVIIAQVLASVPALIAGIVLRDSENESVFEPLLVLSISISIVIPIIYTSALAECTGKSNGVRAMTLVSSILVISSVISIIIHEQLFALLSIAFILSESVRGLLIARNWLEIPGYRGSSFLFTIGIMYLILNPLLGYWSLRNLALVYIESLE